MRVSEQGHADFRTASGMPALWPRSAGGDHFEPAKASRVELTIFVAICPPKVLYCSEQHEKSTQHAKVAID